ncbi:MAG: transposase, partial [Bacillota bacterium]
NNKIKVLKRVSYGVKNFKRFRNRILLTTTKGWD